MLGLGEAEFWGSTWAQIAILYRTKIEWARARDYFPAQLIAFKLTTKERTFSAKEILDSQHPTFPPTVTGYTSGPDKADRGAVGDWHTLKGNLKAITKKKKGKTS